MGDTISLKITDKVLYIQHLDRSRDDSTDLFRVKEPRWHDKPPELSEKKYFCASSLFCGCNEVFILHGKEQYRLMVTSQNKLILTKQ